VDTHGTILDIFSAPEGSKGSRLDAIGLLTRIPSWLTSEANLALA
jgi:hypothetical protein